MGDHTTIFVHNSSKGDDLHDFLFTYLGNETFKRVNTFQRETTSVNFFLLLWAMKLFQKGSTLKEKNLLPEEKILSFKS